MSCTRTCLVLCGSLCVQIGEAESPQWPPKPWEGGLAWENSICRPTSPTSWPFHSISFAMMFVYYKDSISPKIMWFGNVGGLLEILCWKIGFTPQVNRHFCPSWQHSCSGAISSSLWVLSLIVVSWGAHTQFTFQKYPCLGPQMTTSVLPISQRHACTLAMVYHRLSMYADLSTCVRAFHLFCAELSP
jgi:hypothetical protein